jgi:hypothetical protein
MELTSKNPSRTHTITWTDPKASAREASTISGLDYLKAILSGDIPPPPAARLIGCRIVDVEHGVSTLMIIKVKQ